MYIYLDVLDPAILRRFDRQIRVGYPNPEGRRDIFKIHARRINCRLNSIDWEHLASDQESSGLSGADIRNIVNDAALLAVRGNDKMVDQSHLMHAIRRCRNMKNETRGQPLANPLQLLQLN